METFDDYVTVREAATQLGLEYKTLLMRITRGTVTVGKTIGNNKLLHRDEVARIKSLEASK